jgi:2-polyprenyl-3-methyl-5-hydroxy-6-metoxy-1,4-benzoquinol methylase
VNDLGLLVIDNLGERIHKANVTVHQTESNYYELLHPEIYNDFEQKRIKLTLKLVDKLIEDNQKVALDFGAGTGNLTGKLLQLGYKVIAVDISPDMCEILKKRLKNYSEDGRLRIINSPIEDVRFNEAEFDLITCYSVLHHLPDYVDVIRKLAALLKKGGVMYLDHEASPLYWKHEAHKKVACMMQYSHSLSEILINTLYFRILRVNIPNVSHIDYHLSDYWTWKEHHIDHEKIKFVFKEEKFGFFTRIDYHVRRTWIPNPIFYLFKQTCEPNMSLWIAKK